jgi:MFS family permease
MLPCSIAIVSATFSEDARGRALGTMGGIAAVAGAFGPTIGGVLTSAISWRAVLLVNAPIAVACVLVALRSVPPDPIVADPIAPDPNAADPNTAEREPKHVDLLGAGLLCLALVGLVLGLTQTQTEPLQELEVVVPLAIALVAGVLFVRRERAAKNPLMSLSLLRRNPDYLGATLSQGLAGIAEMGLGVLFPLLLILNLEMDPALAGLALIPTTVPMVILAPIAGRWYDRVGGKTPLAMGFAVLAAAGVSLAIGVGTSEYVAILPGLLLYGIGLALVLTVNDPVSLDMVPDADQGQASGVSATAEQGGGALGIALLYSLFHTAYVGRLHEIVDDDPSLPDLGDKTAVALRNSLEAAEQTGLRPDHFDPRLLEYLEPARAASEFGYAIAFLTVTGVALIGMVVVLRLVRRKSELAPG